MASPRSASRSDLGGVDGLPGVARVPLEREALDLQADQLELRDVALLGPDALDPLDLVEGLEVLGGQRARGLGHQDVGERLLDLEDHLPADVGQLVRGHPRRRLRALDPPEALAARLDQLAESDDVLRLGRAPAELVGAVGCGWVRPQRGGDLVRARGLDLERLGAQRGVLACRHRDRLVEREPRQSILRVGQAGNEHEREHDERVAGLYHDDSSDGWASESRGHSELHQPSTRSVVVRTLLLWPARSSTCT